MAGVDPVREVTMSGLEERSAEVAAAYGLGSIVEPLRLVDRGEQARVWRLVTDTGTFAVKEPLRGFEARSDGVDVAFQEAVLAQTRVLIPRPVRRPDGAVLAAVAGADLRASSWVDLLPISVSLDPEQLGRTVAALHQVDFPTAGQVNPWYWAPVGREAFERYADQLTAVNAPFAPALTAAVPELVALESLLEPPSSIRICHRDLWANNLRATPDGAVCVIDWDNCGPADPGHELAMVLYEFGYLDAERCGTIYSSYVDAGGPGRLTRPQQLTMVIAQFGHFWELATIRWREPQTTEEERQHLCEWMAEMADRPLTVDVCHEMVAAVAG